jgi:hypothetical protein
MAGAYGTRPNVLPTAPGGAHASMSENVREEVARTLREFGLEPKGRGRTYQNPYPEFFDTIPYPRSFRVPDFVKFTGEDSKTTYDHIRQFLAQVSDFDINNMHKIRLFSLLLLSSTAFNWFMSLSPNSIDTWEHLEQKFHDYFYNKKSELRLSYIVSVKQKTNENVVEYKKRFRETRNKCYGLTIGEKDLAELAFAGLNMALRDRLEGQDFSDINQVLQ